jgi:hypothetical protein
MDCDHSTDLFDATTIDHWLDCFQALLEAIAADANRTAALFREHPRRLRRNSGHCESARPRA